MDRGLRIPCVFQKGAGPIYAEYLCGISMDRPWIRFGGVSMQNLCGNHHPAMPKLWRTKSRNWGRRDGKKKGGKQEGNGEEQNVMQKL